MLKLFKSNYLRLVLFFSVFNWSISFAKSALFPYFVKEGLQLDQILLGADVAFLGILFLLIFKVSNFLRAKTSWIFAILSAFIYILLIIKISNPIQFYIASFVYGGATFFFYVFYNVAHFKFTPTGKTGHSSAIMFSIGPIISIVAPLLAGFSANINYYLIWIFSSAFFLIAIYFSRFPENFSVKYGLRSAFSEIKATRIFIFLEGIWEAMSFGIIPVFTLFFIKTPLGYGGYLAYLSLVAVLANIFLGRLTDKMNRRIIFLYPITLVISVITFLFPLATSNLIIWIVLTGLLQLFLPLFWNVSTAMVVDAHPNLELAMSGRELMLTLGRILGITLAYVSFSIEKTPFYIFFFLGIVMLAFPVVLFYRKNVSKRFSYL